VSKTIKNFLHEVRGASAPRTIFPSDFLALPPRVINYFGLDEVIDL
jgi:hypothetical protein